jgi:hypothetical protein
MDTRITNREKREGNRIGNVNDETRRAVSQVKRGERDELFLRGKLMIRIAPRADFQPAANPAKLFRGIHARLIAANHATRCTGTEAFQTSRLPGALDDLR